MLGKETSDAEEVVNDLDANGSVKAGRSGDDTADDVDTGFASALKVVG